MSSCVGPTPPTASFADKIGSRQNGQPAPDRPGCDGVNRPGYTGDLLS